VAANSEEVLRPGLFVMGDLEADDVEVPGDIQSIVLYTRLPLRVGDVAHVEEGRELRMFIPMALTLLLALLGAMIFSVTLCVWKEGPWPKRSESVH
jgi:hypothetical protein